MQGIDIRFPQFEYDAEDLVLEGNPTLRHPDGSEPLDPWDVVFFPEGPTGAHGIRDPDD